MTSRKSRKKWKSEQMACPCLNSLPKMTNVRTNMAMDEVTALEMTIEGAESSTVKRWRERSGGEIAIGIAAGVTVAPLATENADVTRTETVIVTAREDIVTKIENDIVVGIARVVVGGCCCPSGSGWWQRGW